ncbi:MAG: TolC family protein, partial [Myxococcota bacterium]
MFLGAGGFFHLFLATALSSCTAIHESTNRRDLARAQRDYSFFLSTAHRQRQKAAVDIRPGLTGYLRLALENSPRIRASFERWQASVHRISQARRLPEPTLGFGYFVQAVETRVGPQRARISLQQTFPWPTKLTAGADAASARARAMQRRFEAQALSVSRRVSVAYWDLWQLRTTRTIHREHLDVIRGLSESVRARMSTGSAMLAELQQIDLAAARIEDNIRGMDEAERSAEAKLRAAIGAKFPDLPSAPNSTMSSTPDAPGPAVMPSESRETLSGWVRTHPTIDSQNYLAEASAATAQVKGAERLPSFTFGADWILTDDAPTAGVDGSGRDAVIVGAAIRLPLWQNSYIDSIEAAEAEARAYRAEQQALIDRAEAELTSTLAALKDATRRIELYRATLFPQA